MSKSSFSNDCSRSLMATVVARLCFNEELPSSPCIVVSATKTTEHEQNISKNILQYLIKPTKFGGIILLILSCVNFSRNLHMYSLSPYDDTFEKPVNHKSVYNNDDKGREREIIWEWKLFPQEWTTESNNLTIVGEVDNIKKGERQRPTLLISQYDSGMDPYYASLLNISSCINQLYAYKYQYDYVALRGIAFRTVFDSFRTPKPSRSTYNKINILQEAIELNYDYLLILDSDAMIYDFQRDVAQLIPSDKMVMAHLVYNYEKRRYYNVNVGVILWNLRHPMVRTTLFLWKIVSAAQILIGLNDNDQNPLQRLLQLMGAQNLVEGNRNEFAYNDGEFVKHFKRSNSRSWTDVNFDDRFQEMKFVADDICHTNYPMCSMI